MIEIEIEIYIYRILLKYDLYSLLLCHIIFYYVYHISLTIDNIIDIYNMYGITDNNRGHIYVHANIV